MTHANDSQMAMLRGMIALAWADGTLDEAERTTLHRLIDENQHLSAAQRTQLHGDIDDKIELMGIWEQITDIQDRAHLINLAVMLFHQDGEYCDLERQAYEQINALHHESLNIDAMSNELSEMAQAAYIREEAEIQKHHESMSRFRRIAVYLDNILN